LSVIPGRDDFLRQYPWSNCEQGILYKVPVQDIATWSLVDYKQPKRTVLKIIKDVCVAVEPLIEMTKRQEVNNKRLAKLGPISSTGRIVQRKLLAKSRLVMRVMPHRLVLVGKMSTMLDRIECFSPPKVVCKLHFEVQIFV
jgi:hypothetical protein